MAVKYEKVVAEDLNLGRGTVSVSMPAGGTATGTRIGLRTFVDAGVLVSALPAAAASAGMLETVSDSTTKTPGATVAGGGAYCVLVFCNGTNWLVVMG